MECFRRKPLQKPTPQRWRNIPQTSNKNTYHCVPDFTTLLELVEEGGCGENGPSFKDPTNKQKKKRPVGLVFPPIRHCFPSPPPGADGRRGRCLTKKKRKSVTKHSRLASYARLLPLLLHRSSNFLPCNVMIMHHSTM